MLRHRSIMHSALHRSRRAPHGDEDPWGSETEDGAPPLKAAPSCGRAWAAAPARPQAVQPETAGRQQRGPDSLYSICLGLLGEHLQELLCDPAAAACLPLLPAHTKACLLAVARLRRLLHDAVLALLADAGQAVLDLRGCGHAVSDGGVRRALRAMPGLRSADLSGCPVGADTLGALGQACPSLEVLRLGSSITDASAARGLRDILPALGQRHAAPAAECWDSLLAVEGDAGALSAAVAGGGRLLQLQCVHWPNVPHRLAVHCREACPQVALNPSAAEVAARRLPPACSPDAQLDAPLLAEVSGWRRWERGAEAEAAPRAPIVHIAERFRLAYLSRQQRVRSKMERNAQQERRREERRRGHAEGLIRQWEWEGEL